MWSNKKWLPAFGLLAVGAFVLAACAAEPAVDDSRVADLESQLAAAQSDASTSADDLAALEEELAMAEEEAAAAAAVVGGECCEVYRIGIFSDPVTTNFWNANGPGSEVWTAYILNGTAGSLYGLSDQRFDFVPSLAADLPPEPVQEGDFYTITVAMREDSIWSDGVPITAHDVVFTYSACLDLQLTSNWPNSCQQGVLEKVEAVNDFTVKFTFNQIPGLAQWQFGAAQGAILPEHFWGETVAEARAFIDGVSEPVAERPADCEAEGLSDEDTAACAEWATYDTAFTDARTVLYQADATGNPVAGGYTNTKFEPGAFAERTANASYGLAGATIEEYADGTWVLTTADGDVLQLYGNAEGEKTLEFVSGPYSDNIVFSIYGSQDAAFLAMADGELDYVLNPLSLARGLREQAEKGEDIVTYVNEDNGLFYLAFNMRKDPYGFDEFRQAVDIVIDKEFVAGSVLQGSVTPTYTIVPPGNAFWYNSDVETPYVGMSREERVNLAIDVLSEAGWSWDTLPAWNEDRQDVDPGTGLRMPNGSPMPDTTILGPGPAYDPQRAVFNQWISEWMRELGMPVTSELTGFATILNPVFVDADFDMYILGWGLTIYPDYLVDFFHSENDTAISGNFNTPGLHSDAFDALGDAFKAETDIVKAQQQALELQAVLAQERPYIPLFVRQSIDLIARNVFLPYTSTLGGIADTGISGFQTDAQVLSR